MNPNDQPKSKIDPKFAIIGILLVIVAVCLLYLTKQKADEKSAEKVRQEQLKEMIQKDGKAAEDFMNRK